MWTLIIMTSLLGQDYRSGSAMAVESVPYFQSEKACSSAGSAVVGNRLPTNSDFKLTITVTCVPAEFKGE